MESSISQKVLRLHEELRFRWQDLCRIAIALYDASNGMLTTFVASDKKRDPLPHYRLPLAEVPSLVGLARQRRCRVIDELDDDLSGESLHRRQLIDIGLRSSYTVPLYGSGGDLSGFLFFDAERPEFFSQELTRHLDVYAELLSTLVQSEMAPVRLLNAAVFSAKRFAHWRNEETGAHLARVAHYARLIADHLTPAHALSDEYIEYLYQFAPLHDIGKVAIPDEILLQQGPLDARQNAIMRTHVGKGLNIVDEMVENFGLGQLPHIQMLRDIVLLHHERWDGGGYPNGLVGEEIPLAARIVGLADYFDALLSARPYKRAWSLERTKTHILEQRERHFDPQCVDALCAGLAQVPAIRDRYVDDVQPNPQRHAIYPRA